MKFTDRGIMALKPKSARYEVWEDGRTGLGLRISPAGRKSWIYMYRHARKARRMTLDTYPAMGLADARLAHAHAKKLLAAGIDPGTQLLERRRGERNAETVADLAREYLDKWARPRKRSAAEDERILNKDVLRAWGTRKAKSITRRDVITLLDGIVDRGAPIQANRTLAVVRRMFNFAIERDILDATPCARIKAPAKENQRDRVLTAEEIATFWHGLDTAPMTDTVRMALRFKLVTAQRKGEVIKARWTEFDMGERVWTIPAERSKNGIAHMVPLSPVAMEILEIIHVEAGESEWLFSSRRTGRPITDQAMNHALLKSVSVIGMNNVTPHDLRRTAASHMTELGIPRLVVSKILNHADPSVTGIYDRYQYGPEKRSALEAWGRRLQGIIEGRPADNVVPLVTA